MRDGRAGRIVVVQAGEQVFALARGAPQDRVDQARPAAIPAPALRQRHGLVDRRVVRVAGCIEELEQPEAERRLQRRVDAFDRPVGELRGQMVAGATPLDGTVGKRLGLGPLAALQAVTAGGAAQGPVGPCALLEHPPQRLVGGAPGRRRAAQDPSVPLPPGTP